MSLVTPHPLARGRRLVVDIVPSTAPRTPLGTGRVPAVRDVSAVSQLFSLSGRNDINNLKGLSGMSGVFGPYRTCARVRSGFLSRANFVEKCPDILDRCLQVRKIINKSWSGVFETRRDTPDGKAK